jgi:5-methylcytosine-specific restriction endonuclease McrA
MKSIYQSTEWAKLRLAALRRDGWRCTICGNDLRGKGQSRVDHIEPVKKRPDLALRLDNLRCLCPSCDNQRHAEKGRGGLEKEIINEAGYPPGWA